MCLIGLNHHRSQGPHFLLHLVREPCGSAGILGRRFLVITVGIHTQGFPWEPSSRQGQRSESAVHLASQLYHEAKKQGETEHRKGSVIWDCWARHPLSGLLAFPHWLDLAFYWEARCLEWHDLGTNGTHWDLLTRRKCLHYLPINSLLLLRGSALAPGFYNHVRNISTITMLIQK